MRWKLALGVLTVSVACVAQYEKEIQLGVSTNVPSFMMIGTISAWEFDPPLVRHNLDDSIRLREIKYTLRWMDKTIDNDLFTDADHDDFRFLSDLGEQRDDALMISWVKDQLNIIVVDGRFLVVAVCEMNEVDVDVKAVFRKVVGPNHNSKGVDKFSVETLHSTGPKEAWGRIVVNEGARGRFAKPIEWFSSGNKVIFAFEKMGSLPASKGGEVARQGYIDYFIGGIPLDDKRSFLRYENSNRQELAREYYVAAKRSRNAGLEAEEKSKTRVVVKKGKKPKEPETD